MTTTDKLVTVAENVEKVYNAGYEKGKSEGGGTDSAVGDIQKTLSLMVGGI